MEPKQILDMDATALAKALNEGRATSVEATEAYIRHLERVNPKINCLTEERFEQARDEARMSDERRNAGESAGCLDGVPISVKDCFHVEGMCTTSGLKHRDGRRETKDAEAVARLRREGAIVLGKTNTPALCFCQETDNKHHGRTNNPWDLNRSAGGSSGGEAALIAAGGAAVGLGADIGGSIRFPAHHCGVIGFKSGMRQVSADGNFPDVVFEEQDRMLGIGAISKSVRDARLIHRLLANEPPMPKELGSFRIEVPGRQEGVPLGDETLEALNRTAEALRGSFEVGNELPPRFGIASRIWQEAMSIDGGRAITAAMSGSRLASPLYEYLKETLNGRSDYHRYLTWALVGARLFQPSSARIDEIRTQLMQGDLELKRYFEHRIAVLPVYHRAAQRHGRLYGELFSVRKTYLRYIPYVAYANTWGLPALTVPIAEDADRLPIAVQLVSANGNEEALFQLGDWLESRFRGYKRCDYYDQ